VLETLEERLTPTALLFGNVYDDVNHDGLYEPSEGLGGVSLSITGSSGTFQTTTTASGNYQIQVPAGTYQVTASASSLAVPLTQTVTIATDNVQLDFVRPLVPPPSFTGPATTTTSTTPTFSWTATTVATQYDLWVVDITHSQQVILNPNITTNTFTPTVPLAAGSYQAWISVTTPFGSSAWSPEFDFTIVPPARPTLTGPTGSTSTLTPTFTWTASPDTARYELLAKNLSTGQQQALDQTGLTSNSYTPPVALGLGSYQAWVQAFNSVGNTAGWSAPISFVIGPPPIPTLTAPTGSSPNTTPTFTWTATSGAASYTLWVSNLTAGTTQFKQQNLTTNSYTPTALPLGSYQAWVEAFNSAGNTAGWSSAISFTVTGPQPPTLTAPTGASVNTSPTFTWSASPGATSYDLWVENLSTSQVQFIRKPNLTTNSFTPVSPLPVGSYVAWVQAYNGASALGGWSAGLNFSIVPPAAPTLTGPPATITSTTPTFTWNTSTGATQYDFWASTAGKVIRQTVTTTSFTPASPIPRGQYTFWVRAGNSAGVFGAWSAGYNFFIDTTAPAIPTITGPSSPTTNVTPTFTWTTGPGAVRFYLWVNLTTGQTVISQPNLFTNSFTPTAAAGLKAGSYVAWVEAFDGSNPNQTRGWSASYYFTITAPAAPSQLAPTGSTSNATPTFSWSAVNGAAVYDLCVQIGSTQVIRQQSLTTTSYTPSAALTKGSYRFWVRAINAKGDVGAWSAEADFTIVSGPS
jgi:predicted phage tail protein